MSRAGLEPTILVLEGANTVHALDSAAGHCDRLVVVVVNQNISCKISGRIVDMNMIR
jgi:hypothetical protein